MSAVRKPVPTKKVAKIETDYVKQQDIQIEKRETAKRIVFTRSVIMLTFVILITAGLGTIITKQQSEIENRTQQYEKLQADLKKVEQEGKALQAEVKKLESDEYIAELARKDYYFSKEDETVFTLPK